MLFESPFTTFSCKQPHIERTQLFSGQVRPVKFACLINKVIQCFITECQRSVSLYIGLLNWPVSRTETTSI